MNEQVTLKNIFGNIVTIQEKCKFTITIEEMIITTNFLIVESEIKNAIIVGKNTLEEIQNKKNELKNIKMQFVKLFNNEPSSGYEGYECEIITKPGKRVSIKYNNIPQSMMEGATKTINNLQRLSNGANTSSLSNPIGPVSKPNGEVRITSNMEFLNNLVEDNNYTIPKIQRIFELTQGKKLFTVIDLKDGYYQIKLKEKDKYRYKTVFYFKNKLF